jgi:hypothetical protein
MKKILCGCLGFISFSNICYATTEAELATLKQQIALLQQQIKILEQKVSHVSINAPSKMQYQTNNLTATKNNSIAHGIDSSKNPAQKLEESLSQDKSEEKSWTLGDTSTKVSLSGFLKLTGIYDVAGSTGLPGDSSSGSGRNYLNARSIGLKGVDGAPSRDLYLHARETRFTIGTTSPIDGKELSTCFEMDFLGDPTAASVVSNGYNFRMRKLYAKYAGFTVGQDWSTFVDIGTFPETVDRNGPVGNSQIRQGLIRYTLNAWGKYTFDFSIENPESEFVTKNGAMKNTGSSTTKEPYTNGIKGENRFSDLVASMKYDFGKGYVKFAALARRNSILDHDKNTHASAMGGAIASSFLYKLFKNDSFVAQLGYGYGAGRYFTDSMNAATYYDGNKLHNQKEFHLSTGYKHQWQEENNIRSTIALGYFRLMNCKELKDNYLAGVISKENAYNLNTHVMSLHMNLMGNINKYTQLGLEYILARRKTEAGLPGTLRRITFAVQVNF